MGPCSYIVAFHIGCVVVWCVRFLTREGVSHDAHRPSHGGSGRLLTGERSSDSKSGSAAESATLTAKLSNQSSFMKSKPQTPFCRGENKLLFSRNSAPEDGSRRYYSKSVFDMGLSGTGAGETMSGYLYKKGASGLRMWQRRYFVIINHFLVYYHNKTLTPDSVKPDAALDLYNILAVNASSDIETTGMFSLHLTGKRHSVLLKAKNPSVAQIWVSELQRIKTTKPLPSAKSWTPAIQEALAEEQVKQERADVTDGNVLKPGSPPVSQQHGSGAKDSQEMGQLAANSIKFDELQRSEESVSDDSCTIYSASDSEGRKSRASTFDQEGFLAESL